MREKQINYPAVESMFHAPIPLPKRVLEAYVQNNISEIKNKAYKENIKVSEITNEPLVNLSAFGISNQSFEWEKLQQLNTKELDEVSRYLNRDVFVRKTVAEKLVKADKKLRGTEYSLYVRSGFRHPSVQEAIFQTAKEKFGKKFARSRLAKKEDLIGLDANYPHATGGVIDLEIWSNGNRLSMGEEGVPLGIFDLELIMSNDSKYNDARNNLIHTKLSNTFTEVPKHWSRYLKNRRLVYHLMSEVGFYFLFSEFWHWGMGDHLSGVASYLLNEKDYKPWYGLAKLDINQQ